MLIIKSHKPQYAYLDFKQATIQEQRLCLNVSVFYNKKDLFVVPIRHVDELVKICKRQNIQFYIEKQVVEEYKQWRLSEQPIFELKKQKDLVLPPEVESCFKGTLYPWQKVGVAWLLQRRKSILADFLGSGKTCQILTVIQYLKSIGQISNGLIICPASLKLQWQSEAHKFTNLKPIVIDESNKEVRCPLYDGHLFEKKHKLCASCYKKEECLSIKHLKYADRRAYYLTQYPNEIFIINYHILRIDNLLFTSKEWGIIAADEVPMVKSSNQTTRCFNKLRCEYFIGASATVIENKPQDIFNVCKKVDIDILGNKKDFERTHIVRGGMYNQVTEYRKIDLLKDKLKYVLIRRSVSEVKHLLPPITYENVLLELHPKQKQVYNEIYTKAQEFAAQFGPQELLKTVVILREACDSAALVSSECDESSKLAFLQDFVSNTEQQVLIFTEWVRMAKLIKAVIPNSQIICGDNTALQRQTLIDQFRNKQFRILIATDCLKEGVNLQFCSCLINFELPWNPAKCKQRIGRLYRLGQVNPVFIYNLFTEGTIEQRVRDVLNSKINIFRNIIEALETIPTQTAGLKQFIFPHNDNS